LIDKFLLPLEKFYFLFAILKIFMKKCNHLKGILLVGLLFSLSCLVAEEINSMDVFLNDEPEPQAIIIDEIYKIVFPSDDEMVVKTQGSDISFSIDNVRVITFGNTVITKVEDDVLSAETSIVYVPQSDNVLVESDELIKVVQIYSLQGVCAKMQMCNSKSLSLDVSDLHNGIYIVVAQTANEIKVEKIIKR
jgi:hypothetical protein